MRQRGFNLLEVVLALAVTAIVTGLVVPPLVRMTTALRVELAAYELVGVLRMARAYAIRNGVNVGLKFRPAADGRVTYTMYRDGDGDGVRTSDLETAVDPQVAPPRRLDRLGRDVRFGFPPGPAPRSPGDPARRISRLEDPVRFNRSDIASFGALGTSTPGSLYLTDGSSHLVVVRVFGRTGKVKVLLYDAETETWRRP